MSEDIKKNLAIVTGITQNWTFALANLLMQLKEESPELFKHTSEIIIYHDGITQNEIDLLNKITKCTFIEYKFPISDINRFNELFFNKFSSLAYSKAECFRLLSEFKQVLWLDVDILITKEIIELIEDNQTGLALLKPETDYPLITDFLYPIESYDMNRQGYGTGTMVFNDNLDRHEIMAEWCYKQAEKYAEAIKHSDQAIFNTLIQDFRIDVAPISFSKYARLPHLIKDLKNVSIIHAAGTYKFWNYTVYYNKFKKWKNYYNKWLKMGGTPYKGPKVNNISRFFLKIFPYAPDPTRHTKKFIIYLFKLLPTLLKQNHTA